MDKRLLSVLLLIFLAGGCSSQTYSGPDALREHARIVERKTAATVRRAQYSTFRSVIRPFYRRYPGGFKQALRDARHNYRTYGPIYSEDDSPYERFSQTVPVLYISNPNRALPGRLKMRGAFGGGHAFVQEGLSDDQQKQILREELMHAWQQSLGRQSTLFSSAVMGGDTQPTARLKEEYRDRHGQKRWLLFYMGRAGEFDAKIAELKRAYVKKTGRRLRRLEQAQRAVEYMIKRASEKQHAELFYVRRMLRESAWKSLKQVIARRMLILL